MVRHLKKHLFFCVFPYICTRSFLEIGVRRVMKTLLQRNLFAAHCLTGKGIVSIYRGILEKGLDDIGSAVCYTIYEHYLCTQLRRHMNPFREFHCTTACCIVPYRFPEYMCTLQNVRLR